MRLLPILSPVVLILLWQIVAWAGIGGDLMPSPIKVVQEFFRMLFNKVGRYPLSGHVYWSMRRVLIAFFIAIAMGLPLGLLMGWSRRFEAIVKPIFEIFRPIPPIAWIPLAILWFGIGETPKVFICWVGAFVPVVMNAYTGVRFTESLLLDAGRTLGASNRQLFFEVAVPSALPAIFAGLQNGLSLAWMCVLAAELVGAREGVGFLIDTGMQLTNTSMVIAGMITIGAVGALIATVLRRMEKVIAPWLREAAE
ncbi:MAG: ABC transporter permease [Chloroflexi bacterium]|nr:ABC transporter permease [Chloroflexota bacterium]